MPRWEITARDPASGRLEAVATSWLFRFRDDVAIRVRAVEGGRSRIDVRSKSRLGRGDFGANAARIRRYVAALREAAAGAGAPAASPPGAAAGESR